MAQESLTNRAKNHLIAEIKKSGISSCTAIIINDDNYQIICHGNNVIGQSVDAETKFHICSCAKPFTTALFSRLIHEGIFSWDMPIKDIVPEFVLLDNSEAIVNFEDLASMRTGLSRNGIAEWGINQNLTKADRISRSRFMKMACGFRKGFSYSNLGYISIALAIERRLGKSYQSVLSEYILKPLGITPQLDNNMAAPQMLVNDTITQVRELTGNNSEASARIYLSANDAVKWLKFVINGFNNISSCGLPASIITNIAKPITPLGDYFPYSLADSEKTNAYGRGLFIAERMNNIWLYHSGAGRGWRHSMIIIPEKRCAIMLMTSSESPLPEAISREAAEILCGHNPHDWQTQLQTAAKATAKHENAVVESKFRNLANATPKIQPGLYHNPLSGNICIENDKFIPHDAPDFTAKLQHENGCYCRLIFDEPALISQENDLLFLAATINDNGKLKLETNYFGQLERLN